ncbi:MAG: PorV/PorQ family protein [Candidatus Hydrothermales bacterium]
MKRFLVLFSVLASFVYAQQKVGNVGADFLSIPLLPEAMGMGGAYTAISSGASSVFWNPSGTADVKGLELYTGYTVWFEDTRVPYFSIVKSQGLYGNFGFFVSGFFSGDMEEWTVEGPTGKYFSYNAYQIGLNYSRYFTDRFASGVSIKYVGESYGSISKTRGIAFDAGTVFNTGLYTIRLGMAFVNLGPDLKPSGEYIQYLYEGGQMNEYKRFYTSYPLPTTFRLGLALDPYISKFLKITSTLELLHPTDYNESFHCGLKFDFNTFYFSTGYFVLIGERVIEEKFNEGGLSLGFGLNTKVKFGTLKLNYSFNDMGILPFVHRFSINFIY